MIPGLTPPDLPIAEIAPLAALDYAGVAVFAATGALAAARDRHDLVTMTFFAAVTGVGGGTLRDLLIGAPVFWVADWRYIAMCIAASVVVWLLGPRPWRFRLLLWLDAFGRAAYGVIGAAKAEAWGAAPLICIVMGALTACFGGVVRDLLAGQPSVLLRREIVVSAALTGATVFVVLKALDMGAWPAAALAVTAAFVLRAGALRWGWSLPSFPEAPLKS